MKLFFSLLIALFALGSPVPQKDGGNKKTPLEIVNERMKHYNNHNMSEFLKLYDENVKIYTYPDKLVGKGVKHMESIFKDDFDEKRLQVEIVSQITKGNHVINHEIVTKDGATTKYVSVYMVKNEHIKEVRFVRG